MVVVTVQVGGLGRRWMRLSDWIMVLKGTFHTPSQRRAREVEGFRLVSR